MTWMATRNRWATSPEWIGVIALLLVAPLLSGFAGHSWWVVPGGVVRRRHRVWRKGVTLRRFGPGDSPLLVDLQRGFGAVLEGKRTCTFALAPGMGMAVVIGWLSTARVSDDALLSFFGPEATWEEPAGSSAAGSP